jgi:ubiquinol oxidase
MENPPAPQLAIDYYNMKPNATLKDMIKKVRADEQKHSDVNWRYSE